MKSVTRIAVGILVATVVFGVYLFEVSRTPQFIAKQARGLRVKDVERLTRAYVSLSGDSSNITNIDQVIEHLAKKGIVIHNPIPIDRNLPSYRIGSPPIHLGALIEETDNVRDDTIRVWSAADGTVIVGLKSERLAKDIYPFPTNPPPPWRPSASP